MVCSFDGVMILRQQNRAFGEWIVLFDSNGFAIQWWV